MSEGVLHINLKEVVRKKAPKYADRIPGFVYSWLGRLIHVDELNEILDNYGHLRGVEFATAIMKYLNISIHTHGDENLENLGRCFFVSNHPLGGADGVCLISFFGNRMKNIRFVVNDLLMHIDPLKPVFLPVNKHGRQSEDYAKQINEAYNSDVQILFFPAGLCSRKIDGEIKDLPWHSHVVKKALSCHRGIVPMYFNSKNSKLFYNIAWLRKILHIKFNIEMLLLPRELFLKKNCTFEIYFGSEIPFEQLNNGESASKWIERIRQVSDSLPNIM